MPIREFMDAAGVSWRVWATIPTRGDVRPQFASGWLTFESAAERRRLAPIPPGWAEAAESRCRALLGQAMVVSPVAGSATAGEGADGAALQPDGVPGLKTTLARARAVIRAVEDELQRKSGG